MKQILLLALLAASSLNASTSGTLAIDTQIPLVMDGKTVGSMTLKAGATVTIVQILPDNQVLISRGDTTNTFKVSKDSLTPESLIVAAATPAPTPAPTTAPVASTETPATKNFVIPDPLRATDVLNFLKSEEINPDMIRAVSLGWSPKENYIYASGIFNDNTSAKVIVTNAGKSETYNIGAVNYKPKGNSIETSLRLWLPGGGGVEGIDEKNISPASLETAFASLKGRTESIEIYFHCPPQYSNPGDLETNINPANIPDLNVVLAKDIKVDVFKTVNGKERMLVHNIPSGTSVRILSISINKNSHDRKYHIEIDNEIDKSDSDITPEYITPESLTAALAKLNPKKN